MSTMRMFYHPDRDSLDLASILHALSDPVRLRIVQSLAQSGELTCGAFGINAPKSTLSHHFKVLREGGGDPHAHGRCASHRFTPHGGPELAFSRPNPSNSKGLGP